MTATAEKRRHARIATDIALAIRTLEGGAKRRGTIADLSMSGMTFESDAELEQGQSLYLKMDIPLEIRGEVRHIRPSNRAGMRRYGVRFHHIGFEGPEGPATPRNFIAARQPRPSVN